VSERTPRSAVLLDTCAVIWLANGNPLSASATVAIMGASLSGGVLVSPISAWEVGLLGRSRGRAPQFLPDPKTWFGKVMSGPGINVAPFTPEIAIDASYLPGSLHGDPADRFIIATARHLGVPIVTRDRKIIDYARLGNVAVIPC
jgi:PIN domain nuclease of toxin-antitoxin system